MKVKTVCLAILYEGEATGYEIRRLSVEGECSYFVEASFGSIYPALSKLEDEGLVTSRVEQQDGKPAKKIYAITEAGRNAFRDALFEPLADETFRSPFLLFARYAHLLPADLVETRLREQLSRMVERREMLEKAASEHASQLADEWIINYGLVVIGSAERYLRDHLNELIALARPVSQLKDAAE
jgi:PadR family transcriptional regulator AphA